MTYDQPDPEYLFTQYFDCADELEGGLTLDDLDPAFVEEAQEASDIFDLSWPPWLPEAEEFALAMKGRWEEIEQHGKLSSRSVQHLRYL